MYRVYCMLGSDRYYWVGPHWVQWSWAAKPLPLDQAKQLAESEQAHVEPMGG
jgi:hypothetical protein